MKELWTARATFSKQGHTKPLSLALTIFLQLLPSIQAVLSFKKNNFFFSFSPTQKTSHCTYIPHRLNNVCAHLSTTCIFSIYAKLYEMPVFQLENVIHLEELSFKDFTPTHASHLAPFFTSPVIKHQSNTSYSATCWALCWKECYFLKKLPFQLWSLRQSDS